MSYTKCGDMCLMKIFILILSLETATATNICPRGNDKYKVCEFHVVIHNINDLELLCGCTVVEGYVEFRHAELVMTNAIPETATFPNLREITGYLMLYKVKSSSSLSSMFPNLAVIRGDTLLANEYSVVIDEFRAPNDFILPSLKVIAKGTAIAVADNITKKELDWWQSFPNFELIDKKINYCSSGCHKDKIDSKVSVSTIGNTSCPRNFNKKGKCCSNQCLGGCEKENDASSCIACRNFREDGHCKENCAKNKYKYRHRCVSLSYCDGKDMLVNKLSRECYEANDGCPINTKRVGFSCIHCPKYSCLKICDSKVISSIEDIRSMAGCQVINGSLIINSTQDGPGGGEVAESLSNLIEVRGYLKISRSALESLNFLKSITVAGNTLYDNRYAIVIEKNAKLKSFLGKNNKGDISIQINRGAVLIESNEEFCESEVNQLKYSVQQQNHQELLVDSRLNGLGLSCRKNVLSIHVRNLISPWNITVAWTSNDNQEIRAYILYYRKVTDTLDEDQFFSDCNENLAQKKYSSSKLKNNSIEVTGLEPHSKYAFRLRGLPSGKGKNAYRETIISNIAFGSTASFTPSNPLNMSARSTSDSTLSMSWLKPIHPNGVVTHYNVTIKLIETNTKPDIISSFEDGLKLGPCDSILNDTGRIPLSRVLTEFGEMQCLHQTRQLIGDYSDMFESHTSTNTLANDRLMLRELVTNDIRVVTRAEETEHSIVDKFKGWIKESSILTKAHSYTFRSLCHFGLYSVSVSACQCASEINKHLRHCLCSSSQKSIVRVQKKDNADQIKDVLFTEENEQGNVKLTWNKPRNVNSQISAYIIELRREHFNKNILITIIKPSNSSNEISILKDIGSGSFRLRITAWNAASNGLSNHWIPFEIQHSWSTSVIILLILSCIVGECIFGFVAYQLLQKTRCCQNWYTIPKYENLACNRSSLSISSYVAKFKTESLIAKGDLQVRNIVYKGSFRTILEAVVHNEENARVAIKLPSIENATPKSVELFLKEILILQNLNFIHVVKLLNIVVDNGEYMYAMEYMANRDLKTFLKATCTRVNLSDQTMLRLAFEAAAAMAYLSSLGIIHGNLSSSNCLLDSNLRLKISGFGMAIDASNGVNTLSFTQELPVRWMAPEVLTNSHFNLNCDIWSYGVLLWEIGTGGQTPYEGMSDEYVSKTVFANGSFLRSPRFTLPIYILLMEQCWQYLPQYRPTFLSILNVLMKDMPDSSTIDCSVINLLRNVEDIRRPSEETEDLTFAETTNTSISDDDCHSESVRNYNEAQEHETYNMERVSAKPTPFVVSKIRTSVRQIVKKQSDNQYANLSRKEMSIPLEEESLLNMCRCKSPCTSPIPKTYSESPLRRTYNKCALELANISSITKKYEEEQIQCLLREKQNHMNVMSGSYFSSRQY